MNAVDKNNSGSIDYTGKQFLFSYQSFHRIIEILILFDEIILEWVMATINREGLLSKQRLDVAFKMFDKVHK